MLAAFMTPFICLCHHLFERWFLDQRSGSGEDAIDSNPDRPGLVEQRRAIGALIDVRHRVAQFVREHRALGTLVFIEVPV